MHTGSKAHLVNAVFDSPCACQLIECIVLKEDEKTRAEQGHSVGEQEASEQSYGLHSTFERRYGETEARLVHGCGLEGVGAAQPQSVQGGFAAAHRLLSRPHCWQPTSDYLQRSRSREHCLLSRTCHTQTACMPSHFPAV